MDAILSDRWPDQVLSEPGVRQHTRPGAPVNDLHGGVAIALLAAALADLRGFRPGTIAVGGSRRNGVCKGYAGTSRLAGPAAR